MERLQQRLAQEPDGVRSDSVEAGFGNDGHAPGVPAQRYQIASNASVFRWKALAGVSFAAFLGVVVSAVWMQSGQRNGPEVASVSPSVSLPSAVVSEAGTGPMLRDPQLDELMAAHRQLGGHSALQVPAGFLRNATYEGSVGDDTAWLVSFAAGGLPDVGVAGAGVGSGDICRPVPECLVVACP